MARNKLKPNTPGTRFYNPEDFSLISTNKPYKKLTSFYKQTAGRNNVGRMTVPCRGGGHKQRYRIIDFKRDTHDISATVKTIEYDPMRSAFISLVCYENGKYAYILHPKGLKIGDKIISGKKVEPEVGNAMPLEAIPIGTVVHNVALDPNKGGVIARSAGTFAQITAKEGKYVLLKLSSKQVRMILGSCFATVGAVSNSMHMNSRLGKAGRSRNLGRRPYTSPNSMNPHDHQSGGGEGHRNNPEFSKRKGHGKGKKTRKLKKKSNKLIIKARK